MTKRWLYFLPIDVPNEFWEFSTLCGNFAYEVVYVHEGNVVNQTDYERCMFLNHNNKLGRVHSTLLSTERRQDRSLSIHNCRNIGAGTLPHSFLIQDLI